jgi:hypothetical protein
MNAPLDSQESIGTITDPNLTTAPLDVREFDDRAVRWLLEPPENMRGVFKILAEQLGDRMDFSRMELLPASLIPAALRERRADLLVRVPFRSPEMVEPHEVIVFVLSEHLSKQDDLLPFWLLYDMVLIWEKQVRSWRKSKTRKARQKLSPIIPVVIYTGEPEWKIPAALDHLMALAGLLTEFTPRFGFLQLNVPAATREDLARHPIGMVLEMLQKGAVQSELEMETALVEAVGRVHELRERDRDAWERVIMILYLLMYHRRSPDEGARLSERLERALDEREGAMGIVETLASTLIEKGKNLGIDEGRREGKREGIRDGARRMARLVVEQKFGALRPTAVRRLNAMSLSQLDALARAVPDARSLDDLGL